MGLAQLPAREGETMRFIDLTHTITEDIPMFPGVDQPTIRQYASVDVDGFREAMITVDSHTGTHMDPPAHAVTGGTTLDQLPASQFVGRAIVVDCRDIPEGGLITCERLERYGSLTDEADFLLFDLGWASRWGSEAYFGDLPLMDDALIDRIVAGHWKGIGFDLPSIDRVDDANMTKHRRLFSGRDLVNVENLCHLDECPDGLFWVALMPIKVAGSDGAPIRAIAWWE